MARLVGPIEPDVDLNPVFKALADGTRRTLITELGERDGQTLFNSMCASPHGMERRFLAKVSRSTSSF